MSDTYYDDENYNDGFDGQVLETGIRLTLWRKLLGYALQYRSQALMLILCAMATASSEVAFPLITRSVIDAVGRDGAEVDLFFYGALYFCFILLLCCSVGGFLYFGGIIRTHVSHDIRRDGFENLQRLSFSYFDYRPVGWLMARMTSDCERLSNILAWGMLDLVWATTMMSGIAVAMLYMDVVLGITVLAILPFLAWISLVFKKRILKSARKVRKTNSRITGSFNESIMGVQTSKAFVKEQDNMNRFSDLTDQMLGSSVLNAVQAALYLPLVLTLGSLATGLALVIGGYQVMGGLITAGTLVAFLTYTRHFFEPIEELAHWFAELQMAQASAERIFSLIEAEPEIRDSSNVIDAIDFNRNRIRHPELHIAEDGMSSLISRIEFRNVSFAYSNGPEVLKNINLTIEQGQSIAIVGSTGGGKSTLANLLCRFYEPTSGSIFIDGVDYRQRSLYWLQSNLGIVLQASHLFGGTIADNIRYSKPGATLNEIIEAAKLAGANSFITRLNQGYDFVLTESGNNLSAGQKQLIAFTRAILADPRILVMDEATSSIDTITEHYIQKGMKQLLLGRISLIIAHRLSTIRNADRIIVVESGQIVEQGSHRELMSLGQRYRTLYSQQRLCSGSPDVGIWQVTQTIDAAT